MKKVLLSLLLLMTMAFGPVPMKAIKQLVDLEGVGRCTAWSYKPGVWITANHCTTHQEQLPLKIIKQDAAADLAAFKGEKAPTLQVATVEPTYLDKLVVVGYPGGQPAFYAMTTDVVAFTKERIQNPDLTLEFVVVRDVGIGGMSGSPALNQDGQVVGIVHAGGDTEGVQLTGITRLRTLREFLKGLK